MGILSAQVGINTNVPQTPFHIDGAKDNPTALGSSPTTSQQLNDVVVTKEGRLGIGTISPTTSVEVATQIPTGSSAQAEGIVIPAVSLAKLNAIVGSNLVEGTLVYVNNTGDADRNNLTTYVVTPGFYKYNGTLWVKLMTLSNTDGMNVVSLIYPSTSGPILSKQATCGSIQFRMAPAANASYGRPQIRALVGSGDFNYGYMLEYDRNKKYYQNINVSLNSTWVSLDTDNSAQLGASRSELITIHGVVAGETGYYRIKFFSANNVWSAVCTRF